jgi:hypothetical protein
MRQLLNTLAERADVFLPRRIIVTGGAKGVVKLFIG